MGRRDYAILTMLARLGVRGAEVADLTLDDVDWRGGEVTIRGKGNRIDRLPLPVDVGEALASYLMAGRPRCDAVTVFCTVRAPYRRLSPAAVRAIMGHACHRAGLDRVGAHRLRHWLATEMLDWYRDGETFKPACRCCPPGSAMSTRSRRIGICKKPRECTRGARNPRSPGHRGPEALS